MHEVSWHRKEPFPSVCSVIMFAVALKMPISSSTVFWRLFIEWSWSKHVLICSSNLVLATFIQNAAITWFGFGDRPWFTTFHDILKNNFVFIGLNTSKRWCWDWLLSLFQRYFKVFSKSSLRIKILFEKRDAMGFHTVFFLLVLIKVHMF